jgi:CshA-type fibril repeat protein
MKNFHLFFIKMIFLSFLIIQSQNTNAQCPGTTMTLVDSTTSATCPNNGKISITVTGGISPYQYAIVAGPVLRPNQSSKDFNSLQSGTYNVRVTDFCGTQKLLTGINVVSNYTEMTATTSITHPTCNTPGNGSVTVNLSGGTAPITYELLLGASVVRTAQPTGYFGNLPSGTYTARTTDYCGEVRTFSVGLVYVNRKFNDFNSADNNLTTAGGNSAIAPEPYYNSSTGPNLLTGSGPILINCDTVAFRIQTAFVQYAQFTTEPRRVYVRDLATNNIVFDSIYVPSFTLLGAPTIKLKINKNYRIYLDDLCDDVDSTDRNFSIQTNFTINGTLSKTCSSSKLSFNWDNGWNKKNYYSAPSDTITIISGPSLVGEQRIWNYVNTPTGLQNLPSLVFDNALPGTYVIEVKNICGSYTRTQNVLDGPDWTMGQGTQGINCKLNTANKLFYFVSQPIGSTYYIRITGGPASFTDDSSRVIPITYPLLDSSVSGYYIPFNGLPMGTYTYEGWTSCDTNAKKYSTMTITSSDIFKYSGEVTHTNDCPGTNSITLKTTEKQWTTLLVDLQKKDNANVWQNYPISYNQSAFQYNSIPDSIEFVGLPSGSYRVVVRPWYIYNNRQSQTALTEYYCNDTLLIKEVDLNYTLPEITTEKIYICNPSIDTATVHVNVLNGVMPFVFEELAIPSSAVITSQADSIFNGLDIGIHRFRVTDGCGNAVVKDIEIKILDEIIGNGSTCLGDSATFTAPGTPALVDPWISSDTLIAKINDAGEIYPYSVGSTTITYTNIDGCTRTKVFSVITCAPIAVNDYDTTAYNTPLISVVNQNDTCVNPSTTCTFSNINTPSNGSLVFQSDGSYTYTPNLNYSGIDSFRYAICDGYSICDTALVVIYVDGSPIANPDYDTTDVNTILIGNLSTNDFCGANPPCSVTSWTTPDHGNVSINPNGTYQYTPDPGYVGEDSFIYTYCDLVSCDTALVSVYVNAYPIANDSIFYTQLNTQVYTTLPLSNYCGNEPCDLNLVTPPSHGSFVGFDPVLGPLYEPNPGFVGIDTFTYYLCDADGDCDTAMVLIVVGVPVANPDDFTVPMNSTANIPVLNNDSFGADGPSTGSISVVSNGTNGVASVDDGGTPNDPTDDKVNYTPNNNFVGYDSVIYEICDGNGDCDTALVVIYVDGNPIADPDYDTTEINTQLIGDLSTNDHCGANPPCSVTSWTTPAHGTLSINPNGTYTYTPDSGYIGDDSFIYTYCDLTNCDTALVSIYVNDHPIANDTIFYTQMDSSVYLNTPSSNYCGNAPCVIDLVSPVQHGSFIGFDPILGTLYLPNPGYTGIDTLIYSICDNDGDCDTGTVFIYIGIPMAVSDYDTTFANTPITVSVLTNDSFGSDGPSTSSITVSTNGSNGVATVDNGGTPNDPTDDKITYIPNLNFVGEDSIQYQICDLNGDCDIATIYISVEIKNTTNAVNDQASTWINTPASGDVTTNDFDAEGNTQTFGSFLNPAQTSDIASGSIVSGVDLDGNPVANAGTLTFNSNGTYTFTPANNFTGNVAVAYNTCDNGNPVACDTASLDITVSPQSQTVNSVIANNDEYFSNGNAINSNVLINDSDPQENAFTVTSYTYDSNGDGTADASGSIGSSITVGGIDQNGNPVANAGLLTQNANGTFTFVPTVGFIGEVVYNYIISDDANPIATDNATVSITVLGDYNGVLNNPPFAGDDFTFILINTPTTSSFLSNDTDPNGDPLSYNGITLDPNGSATPLDTLTTIQGGTVVVNQNGTYTYTPPTDYIGPDYVEYEICDVTVTNPQPLCSGATINLLVGSRYNISGTVFHDVNGMTDTLINGTGTNVDNKVYAVLTDANGTVITSVLVDTNGSYEFTNVQVGVDLIVLLDTLPRATGVVVTTATLPSGWESTGEGYDNQQDGTPNGKLTIVSGASGTSNTNFGIQQPPIAMDDTQTGSICGAVIVNILGNDSDVAPGILDPTSVTMIPPVGATDIVTDANGDVTWMTIPGEGTWIVNPSTGSITFTPLPIFTGSPTPITYTVDDNGGFPSNPAIVTITISGNPDFTPTITILPSIIIGASAYDALIEIKELANFPSDGSPIRLFIAKNPSQPITFNPTQTELEFFEVDNSLWTLDNSNPNFYIFTTTQTIPAQGYLAFAISSFYDPSDVNGDRPLSVTIYDGGGEIYLVNNTDADILRFFAE